MQNFVNFFTPTIKTNSAFYIPGGDAKVSFVDVRNIAAVAAKVLTEHDESESRHFGKVYNITGPEALSYCSSVVETVAVRGLCLLFRRS